MSQILIRPKNHILYSELCLSKLQAGLKSSVTEARCQICKSPLKEGISITAKKIGEKTMLVCSKHNF